VGESIGKGRDPFLKRLSYAFFKLKTGYTESEKTIEEAARDIKKGVVRGVPASKKNVVTLFDALFEYILDVTEAVYRFFYPHVHDINVVRPVPRLLRRLANKILTMTEKIYLIFFHPFRSRTKKKSSAGITSKIKQNYHTIFVAGLVIFIVRSLLTSSNPKYFIIYVIAALIFLTMYINPLVGLLMYYTTQMIIPSDVIYSFPNIAVGTPLMFGTILFWVLGMTRRGEKFATFHSSTGFSILWIWMILTMSTLMKRYGDIDIYLNITTLFLGFFMSTHIVQKDREKFYKFMLLVVFIYGFYAWRVIRNGFYFGFGTGHPVTADFTGALADNNELASAMCIGMAMMFGFSCIAKNKFVMYLARFFALLLSLSILLTNSRGGMLGLFITAGGIYFKVIIRGKSKTSSIVILVVVALIVGSLFSHKISKRMGDTKNWQEDPSACNRVIGFWAGWQVLKENPFLGCGLGGLYYVMMDYIPNEVEVPNLSLWEWFDGKTTVMIPKPSEKLVLHDAYMSFGAEGGFGIFILFPTMLISVFKTQKRLRKEIVDDESLEGVYHLSNCIDCAMYGYMLTATFLNNYMGNSLYLTCTISAMTYNIFSKNSDNMHLAELGMLFMSLSWWSYFFLLYYRFVNF